MANKKLLVVFPVQSYGEGGAFFVLVDPEDAVGLASRISKTEETALKELYYDRPDRVKALKKKYGKDIEVRLLKDTKYTFEGLVQRSKERAKNL